MSSSDYAPVTLRDRGVTLCDRSVTLCNGGVTPFDWAYTGEPSVAYRPQGVLLVARLLDFVFFGGDSRICDIFNGLLSNNVFIFGGRELPH